MAGNSVVSNRLVNEKSPYLLQHAYNPVNWYPWGKEAFEKAKLEDKPVFLLIGYSTCHWCHVMEEESFEDFEVADILNKNFVSIKVDKEERPDIDSIYMSTCQALTGHGGWPLTIIMTPEQKPFFAGTYFPKKSRYGMPGLIDILQTVKEKWNQNKDELINASEEIIKAIKNQYSDNAIDGELSNELIHNAYSIYKRSYDSENGGFGNAPKFPASHNLMFLLRYFSINKEKAALEMVEKTLQQMYRGGLFDHVGFGFSRYSTDEKWLVPHFEKMLYDNALLTMVYLEAYQITKKELYKTIAIKTMEYILREMTDDEGGFYSAQDADSDGQEGKYYLLTPEEVVNVLGKEDGSLFNSYFQITKRGNFEGKNIPNLLLNNDYEKNNEKIDNLCKKIYEWRKGRTKLHKDDKILTSWNGLMICAFAKAYRILGDEKYINAAKKAENFISNKLIHKKGYICVHYREGQATGMGTIDDYAFYIWSLIELYQATFEASYLKKALKWNGRMIESFSDNECGGFFMTSSDSEELIYRPKELYDGAMPSGNSAAAYNLLVLARLTGDIKLEEAANNQLKFMAGAVDNYPVGFSHFMSALMFALNKTQEIVCVISNQDELQKLKKVIREKFLPTAVFLVKNVESADEIDDITPLIKDYHRKDNKSAYYLCENNTCQSTCFSIEELISKLQ